MNIIINYKKKLPSKEIPINCNDISSNISKKNFDMFKNKLIENDLFTIIDFHSYNYFKNFILTDIIKYILTLYPKSYIKLKNLNIQQIIFTCDLKDSKLFDAPYLSSSLPTKINKHNNYLLTIQFDDIFHKFLFINEKDTPDNIKNTISKIKHNKHLIYYETDVLGVTCIKFIKEYSNYILSPIKKVKFSKNIIKSPYIKSYPKRKPPNIPKLSLPKSKVPFTSPSVKSYLVDYKTPKTLLFGPPPPPLPPKDNIAVSILNNYAIQPYQNKPHNIICFSTDKIETLQHLNLTHYQHIIELEQKIERFDNEDGTVQEIKDCIQDKIKELETYLDELKRIIRL